MMENGLGQPLTVGMAVMYITNESIRKGILVSFEETYTNSNCYVPKIKSWTRSDTKGYTRILKSCHLVFPINETVEEVQEWCNNH